MKIKGWMIGISILMTVTVCRAATSYIESQRPVEPKAVPNLEWHWCGDRDYPLRLATFTTNPPFGWTEKAEGDTLISRGFGIDFVRNLLNEARIATESVGFASDREAMEALATGAADVYVGGYYDPKQRMAGHTYMIPSLFQNMVSVIFLKGKEKPIAALNDLIGMKGVVRRDEIFYSYIHAIMPSGVRIERVIDSREAFTKLLTGEVDYMLSSPYSAEAEARRFKMNQDIKMVQLPIAGQELFVVFSGRSACPQYGRVLGQLLAKHKPSQDEAVRMLFNYMNEWGERFRDQPSLKESLSREGQKVPQVAEKITSDVTDQK